MRITSSMISNQYKRNLNNSLGRLNYYNIRATNYRKFQKSAEDPMGAAHAFHLRRELSNNTDYMNNIEDANNLFLSAQSSMMSINSVVQEAYSDDCLKAITGTMSESDRKIMAEKLRSMSSSIVMTMNSKFSDKYMFGGINSSDQPFSISDGGNLLYRGIDVNTGMHIGFEGSAGKVYANNSVIDFGNANGDFFNGFSLNVFDSGIGGGSTTNFDSTNKSISIGLDMSTNPTNAELQKALQSLNISGVDSSKILIRGDLTVPVKEFSAEFSSGKDPIAAGTVFDLNKLATEKHFIDLGLGIKLDSNGNVNEQSAFDIALPGISFIGFGKNSDGVSNNVFTLMNDIASKLDAPDFSIDSVKPLLDNFDTQRDNLLQKITQFGSKSNFIDYTKKMIDDNMLNIETKINTVEYIDPAEAITDFKMMEFAYRTALQMGTKILQPSFLDFMR